MLCHLRKISIKQSARYYSIIKSTLFFQKEIDICVKFLLNVLFRYLLKKFVNHRKFAPRSNLLSNETGILNVNRTLNGMLIPFIWDIVIISQYDHHCERERSKLIITRILQSCVLVKTSNVHSW